MSEQSLSPITQEGKRVGLRIKRWENEFGVQINICHNDYPCWIVTTNWKIPADLDIQQYRAKTLSLEEASVLHAALTEAIAQAKMAQPRKAAKIVKAIDLHPGMIIWEMGDWCKVTDNWDANETGTRREITVERPGDLPPRNKRATFWAHADDEFTALEATDTAPVQIQNGALESLTDEQWYRGQAVLRHERDVRSNPSKWDEPIEVDNPFDLPFGDLTPSTGCADRQCPTCGECRDERLIPTGEKPPKPAGEVIRTTSYRVFFCSQCRIVTVDAHKWVYVGDGDHDPLRATEGTEFTIPYSDWFDKNYDGPAIAAVFASQQKVAAAPNLTPTQWKALELIARHPGVINSAHTFHFTTGDKLVERGLATAKQRDPYLRRYEYTITEAGREAMANRRAEVNKQGPNGIEYVHYTHNVSGGCFYRCEWEMPDGTRVQCYAKSTAEGLAQAAYPHGFEHAYWREHKLIEPLRVKMPQRIFLNSMSDLMGHWFSDEQIASVLAMCQQAYWHDFLLLTKNPPRLPHFAYPPNVWVGISVPPTFMNGKSLTLYQQQLWLRNGLESLASTKAAIKWLSAEPLSWDVADVLYRRVPEFLDWMVIGAASNGKAYYQPDPWWVKRLLIHAEVTGVKVFFKGNLRSCPAADPWREEYPDKSVVAQAEKAVQP